MKKQRLSTIIMITMILFATVVVIGIIHNDNTGLLGDSEIRARTSSENIAYDSEAINKYIGVPLAGDISDDSEELKNLITNTCNEINEVRKQNGIAELKIDNIGALADTAVVRANECYIKWSHIRPNGTQWYTVNSEVQWGENLAYGYNNADSVVNAWLNSPEHRDNILNSEFKTMSIKIFVKDGIYYWAQEFDYN